MPFIVNDPENIDILRDRLTEYGFEADDECLEAVLTGCAPFVEKIARGDDLSYGEVQQIEGTSTYVATDMSEEELENYTEAVMVALEIMVASEED